MISVVTLHDLIAIGTVAVFALVFVCLLGLLVWRLTPKDEESPNSLIEQRAA